VIRLCIIILTFILTETSFAQSSLTVSEISLKGDRLSGVVLPVLPRATDITVKGLRANAWTVDDTKRLLVEQNFNVTIGAYTFDSDIGVVWINRMETDAGVVSQIAVYLPTFTKSSKHATMGAEGENLLVVGSTLGKVTLDVALLEPKKPKGKEDVLRRATTRLATYIQNLTNSPDELSSRPKVIPFPEKQLQGVLAKTAVVENRERTWLKPKSGFVSISANLVELLPDELENTITLTGDVHIVLRSFAGISDMEMSATRSVVFTDPGGVRDIASGKIDISDIHGIYLEGNVVITANSGKYLLRAPQMYYDFKTEKAIMLEAILRTYVEEGSVPMFIRADELRQISENEWVGTGVQASTSAFATPDIAVGATKMTITKLENGNTYIKSRNNTIRFGGVPIMYWPKYEGEADGIPLRGAKVGFRDDFGLMVETKWDLYSLLGIPKPEGVKTTLRVDTFTERGSAVGIDFLYSADHSSGLINSYFQTDSGTQKTASGIETPVTNKDRGYFLWTNKTKLNENWNVQTQLNYISDPTYMSVWRQQDYNNHPEYETSIYAKYQKENLAFTALLKSDLNKFISTSWLLASRQYKVDKTPELGFFFYGEKLLNDAITWSSQTKIMRERMIFQSGTPNELGLRRGAFGLPSANTDISAPLIADGLQENYQNRLVTRQEFSMPLQLGAIKLVPYASIQAQWGISNNEEVNQLRESNHWFRTVGLRASTQFNRIFNNVDNDLLDLHRLRHVIEPYLTVWNGDSNVDISTIPQYDASIDNISEGSLAWVGVRNTLQTWRGGPGRWYKVDWLTLDTSLLFSSNGSTQRYDNPQFFNWRPEYSSIQDAFIANGKFQYSDSVAFIGNGTWNLDDGTFSRGSIGAELDHGRDVRTYLEYREIDVTNDQLLSLGINYDLSKRYSLNFSPSWNFHIDDLQSLNFVMTRHYPEFDLIGGISYNEIRDETEYSFRFKLLKF
tara:strand:- start:1302 stop:4187 length:2886 start_codon:yes stop_codon:yes gene_type:complete